MNNVFFNNLSKFRIHAIELLLFLVAVTGVTVANVQAPASIEGSTIKLNDESFSPSDISIIKYIPQGAKAQLIIHYGKEVMPRIHVAGALTGAKTKDEVYQKEVRPAIVIFTEKKGNVYHGTVEGSWASSQSYRGEMSSQIASLKNQNITFILPDNNTPQTGTVKAPETIKNGALIQIQTDKRTLKYQLGKGGASLYRYTPKNTTATIEFMLPNDAEDTNVSLLVSGEDVFQNAVTCFAAAPRIVFTEKSGKTYKGALCGYLYGYKTIPKPHTLLKDDYIALIKEKLIGITITLPGTSKN